MATATYTKESTMTNRQQLLRDARHTAGYRHASYAKSTGSLVVLVNSEEQGIDADMPWTLICEEHSTLMQFETRSNAKSWMAAPEQWCEDCQENHYRIAAPEEVAA